MDLWQFIANEHTDIEEIFRETLGALAIGEPDRTSMFEQLKLALDRHSRMEEAVFYPALQQYDETRHLVADALDEHQEIKKGLEELSLGDAVSGDWVARLKDLQEQVEEHVREEEDEIFPAAKQVVDAEEAEDLRRRMEEMKLGELRSGA